MSRKNLFLISILLFSVTLNFIGTFIPETGFDALWYHLTLAKTYSQNGISHIPGGLLYYSELPRLAETLSAVLMKWFGQWGSHFISFFAGVGSLFILYKVCRRFFDQNITLLVCILFYCTPLVSWQSGSGYIDLVRTFFEVLAFYFLLNKKFFWLAVSLGLGISTKTLVLGSLPIYIMLMALQRTNWKTIFLTICGVSLIVFPWYFSSHLSTGYWGYPIGAGILDHTHDLKFGLANFIIDYWKLFMVPDDLISPVYVAFLPFLGIYLYRSRLSGRDDTKNIFIYFILSYVVWYFTPRTGGGRFILPYLPVWSLLVGFVISKLESKIFRNILTFAIVFTSIINIFYRVGAMSKGFKYLIGKETMEQYLCKNLDFSLGNFVDCDGWFAKNIKPGEKVLVSGVHNLYYINFPHIHESWYRGEKVNYLLIQNDKKRQAEGELVYTNNLTNVRVYKL